jgi:hypothetical protein
MTHKVVDWVELSCLASADGIFSLRDLEESRQRLRRERRRPEEATDPSEILVATGIADAPTDDAGLAAALGRELPEEGTEPVPEGEDDEGDGESEDPVAVAPATANAPGLRSDPDDADAAEASDVLGHLKWRVEAFGDRYPFVLDVETLQLKSDLSSGQCAYLFLLLAASLGHIEGSHHPLTSHFEANSEAVLRAYLGPIASIYVFGTSSSEGDHFHGTLWCRLQRLARDLRVRLLTEEDELSAHNVGDSGLDIVAWFPFDDRASNLVTIFGQCACGAAWDGKLYEATAGNWRVHLAFTSPLVNVLFIPHCYRQIGGAWFERVGVKEGVLIDRLRITLLMEQADTDLPLSAEVRGLVNGAIAQEAEQEAA